MHRAETYRFCPRCGGPLEKKILKKSEPSRLFCGNCGFIFYLDPKIAAAVIVEIDGAIVLARRAINPARGKWVIPGGFVDLGEPVTDAACRETWEEVRLRIALSSLVGVYSYPDVSVAVVIYAAKAISGIPEAGDETLEARLFHPSDIPWEDIAFASTADGLRDYLAQRHTILTR
ncbi:MAG: NUDIX hydrolase [Deltaproteobacteria bacterium]|nr:NUDIX hydrolase [Deltaproteobacteria bacterium]